MKKVWREWKRTIFFGLLVLGIGLGLRLYNLTLLPVFADEAIYIRWAQIMANEPSLRFLPLSDGKQPLYHWFLMFVIKGFSDPLFAGRAISIFTGLGTIIGLFLLTYSLFKSRLAAVVAALFWAISPFGLFYDRLALVDSQLTMFSVWTALLGLWTAKTRRLDLAMLTGFVLGGALLTKSSGLFFALLLPTVWLSNKNFKKNIIRYLGLLGVTYAIAFAMYNIQRLGPNFELLSLRTRDYVFPIARLWTHPGDPFVYNLPTTLRWVSQIGPVEILPLAIFAFLVNFARYKREVILLSLWFIVPIITQSALAKSFTTRYILFSVPFLFALGASLALATKEIWQKAFTLGVIIFIFHSLWIDSLLLTNPVKAPLPRRVKMGFFQEWTAGNGIREIAEFIKTEHGQEPETKIVVGTEGYFGTLPNGLEIYLEGTPNVIVKGIGLAIAEVPQDLIDSKSAGNKTYLVVNNSRLVVKPEELDLTLLASYPKELRFPGTMEYHANGPQEVLYLFEVQ